MGSGHYFPAAEAHCVRLAPDCNVFAVNATNDLTVPNPAGVLVAIQIKYTDGFTQNIVSDGTWHAFTSVPAGFQQVGFDDSAWPPATIEANYGASPWGQIITPPSASSAPLSLTDANWIWTNEVSNSGTAPAGSRAFRKVITLPDGQKATSATVVMGADDAFTLYVNGRLVGSNSDYTRARRFVVDIQPSVSTIDIAVFANNVGGPAGLIGSFELEMEDCDCGSRITFVTDGTWKYNSAVPSPVGFQEPGFDDSQWPVANVEGKYGIAPWGSIAIPDAVSPASAKIVGAPDANAANVVT
ncbi:hypothetical protein B0H34DRAFT_726789 [Crassisporium funariophilum]|nr:hypothetical protein B0H34DRAFT_726789 [Crassisporium funariophilum]